MINFSPILSGLQGAIAARAARDRGLAVLLVAMWGRIARMRTRLERLIALWRAGRLPAPRKLRAGAARAAARATSVAPRKPAWVPLVMAEAQAYRSQLEHLLSREECQAFLAAVPQAGRIIRPLCEMLGIGVSAARLRRAAGVWAAAVERPVPAGLVVGPDGRLNYV